MVELVLVGVGVGAVSRSVCAVVMVRRWRVCGEMRESLADEHVVDGVVSLCCVVESASAARAMLSV